MSLKCRKCGQAIPLPPAETRSQGLRLECPRCNAVYRLRARRPTQDGQSAPPPPPSTSNIGTWTPTTPISSSRAREPVRAATPPSSPASTAAPPTDARAALHPSLSSGLTLAPSRPSGSTTASVLEPGEMLAGRYRIVRFLASGGMGEVYEAEDLELRERVALKTIRSHMGGQDMIERFKREIHLARKVTHPNVCRIFDLGHHVTPDDDPAMGGLSFLTMELLEGETLAARLRRDGRLTTSKALPLARQMAAALDAAHGAGIVHRDFKSENIFLVEPGDTADTPPQPNEPRVVVTDFGVARGGQSDRFAAQVTSAVIVGTPAYMAPEQVEGGPLTATADVYALGVVLYEMVTGKLPFESENPLTSAVKRLQEAPKPPHVHVPDLDPRWEKVILRCLARQPQDRFASAGEAIAALSPTPLPKPPSAAVAQRPATLHRGGSAAAVVRPAPASPAVRRMKVLLSVLLLVVLASAGLRGWNHFKESQKPRVTLRRAVAILGFNNVTERPEVGWLSTALAEMLATELSRGESLRIIPGENVARMKQEMHLGETGALSSEILTAAHGRLGCDFIVHGSYLSVAAADGEQIRVDLRLQDAVLGNILASFDQMGSDSELFTMVAALGKALREQLGIDREGGLPAIDAGIPSAPKAARLYAEALASLHRSEPLKARDLLLQTLQIDDQSAMVHYTLSSAWQALGYVERAAEEAERAFELSSRLSREDRLMVEGRFHETRRDWPAAIEVYEALWSEFPDNVEYGLRLVEVQIAARQLDGALATVDELRRLPTPHADDPRIALAEASAAGLANRFKEQLEAATRAATDAETLGAAWLLARARVTQSQAQRFLGEAFEAATTAEQALEIYRRMNHPAGSAIALTTLANAFFDQADFTTAATHFQEAIALYQQIGDQGGKAATLNNLALTHKRRGDLDGALIVFEQAEKLFTEIGDHIGRSNALNNLAVILVSRDQLAKARQHFEQALAVWEELQDRLGIAYALNNLGAVERLQGELVESRISSRRALDIRRQIGHRGGEAASLTNLGGVLSDLGEVAEAEERLTAALALAEELGDRSIQAQALYELGELQRRRDLLPTARASHERALDLRRELEEGPQSLASQIALAHLDLAEAKPEAAEVAAQLALRQALRDQLPLDEAHTRAVLALALFAQQRQDAGQRELEEAARSAIGGQRFAALLWVDLAAAEGQSAKGESAAALQDLRQIELRAQRAGHLELYLETILLQAQNEHLLGDDEAARRTLQRVIDDAEQHGFALWSRRARSLLL